MVQKNLIQFYKLLDFKKTNVFSIHGLQSLGKSPKKVEARNFEIRKSLLKFDDVMNEQRKIIYEQRREIINDIEIDNLVFDMRDRLYR